MFSKGIRGVLEIPAYSVLIFLTLFPLIFGLQRILVNDGWSEIVEAFLVLMDGRSIVINRLLLRSLIVAAISVVIAIAISPLVTRYSPHKGINPVLFLITLPFFINDGLKSYAWVEITQVLIGDAAIYKPWSSLIALVPNTIPIAIFLVSMSIQYGKARHLIVYREFSQNSWEYIYRAYLPSVAPYSIAAFVLVFILSFASSVEENYLGGPFPITFQVLMESYFRTNYELSIGLAIVYAAILLIGLLLMGLAWRIFQTDGRLDRYLCLLMRCHTLKLKHRNTKPCQINYHFYRLLCVFKNTFVWILVVYLWLPLFYVLLFSFLIPGMEGEKWTLINYIGIFTDDRILRAVWNTIYLSGLAAMIGGIIGIMFGLLSYERQHVKYALIIVALPALMPADGYGLLWINNFRELGVYQGSITFGLIGILAWVSPFLLGLAWTWSRGVQLKEISMLVEMDISWKEIVYFAYLKRMLGMLFSCASLGFVFAFNDYIRASYLLGSHETLTGFIHGRLNAGSVGGERDVYAVGVLVIMLTSAIIFSIARYYAADTYVKKTR